MAGENHIMRNSTVVFLPVAFQKLQWTIGKLGEYREYK